MFAHPKELSSFFVIPGLTRNPVFDFDLKVLDSRFRGNDITYAIYYVVVYRLPIRNELSISNLRFRNSRFAIRN